MKSLNYPMRTSLYLLLVLMAPHTYLAQPSPQATTPQPTPTALPSILDHNEKLELTEYRLAEKVQSRVIGNLAFYGTVLGIVVAFIGFLGFATIRDTIARRVEDDIKKSIEKEIDGLRSKTQSTLLEIQTSLSESKQATARIQEQFQALQLRHSELETLSSKFEELHGGVLSISSRVEDALSVAKNSAEKAEALKQDIVSSFAGTPTIIGTSFGWSPTLGSMIQGSNFGSTKGKVRLVVYAHLHTDKVGREISVSRFPQFMAEIPPDRVQWSDTEIKFRIDETIYSQIEEYRKRVRAQMLARGDSRELAWSYEPLIETADGRRSGYVPPFTRLWQDQSLLP